MRDSSPILRFSHATIDVALRYDAPIADVSFSLARGELMLARVDGKSPVEYLTRDADKDLVRAVAEALLLAPPTRLAEVAGAWARALDTEGD